MTASQQGRGLFLATSSWQEIYLAQVPQKQINIVLADASMQIFS